MCSMKSKGDFMNTYKKNTSVIIAGILIISLVILGLDSSGFIDILPKRI